MNTFSFLTKSARHRPEGLALVHGAEVVTYRQFHDRALAIGGNLLAAGCVPGDRVAFCLGNSPRILELIFGCLAAGLIVVPINARLHAREIAYIVENSAAKILVHGGEFQEGIEEHASLFAGTTRYCTEEAVGAEPWASLVDPARTLRAAVDAAPQDLCWLFYTSGTTGKPKGAMWNHRMVRTVIMNYLADLHNIAPGEVVLHCAPLSHGSGIVALPAIARGAVNAIMDTASFDVDALLTTVQRLRVSHIAFMAPTQIVKLLEDYRPGIHDFSSLQAICYGGAPIYVEHLRQAIETFGSIFVQLYGQGEAPITITGMSARLHRELLEAGDPRIGSAGQVRTDVEARSVDPQGVPLPPGQAGEVVVRGDVVMPGYWRNPEASAEALRDGWLHTGDIGYFDEHGFLFLLDRAKDMVISGGNNVYPREVEEVVILHPKVGSCVVFGVPDDYWGEAVHAVVVPVAGETLTAQEIIDFCGKHMAGYKKPKGVDFVDALPVSGYGKILRREVRDQYWQGHAGRIGGGSAAGATGR